MANGRKKFNITLKNWYFLSMYGGVTLICLIYPQLQEQTWLWTGVQGSRAFLLLWAVLILALDLLHDRTYLKCMKLDLHEKQARVKNGGLHLDSHMALTALIMFALDFAAVAHFTMSYVKSGAQPVTDQSATFRALAVAAGIILWIYGRSLIRIRYKSIWGIRTRASMKSVEDWGRIHLSCIRPVCLGGAVALVCGALLPPVPALVGAAAGCLIAFGSMLTAK